MGKTFRLPRLFRKEEPELTDGLLELAVAHQVYSLLQPLPITSQKRVLNNVNDILSEREQQLAEFDEAIVANDHTRLSRRTA